MPKLIVGSEKAIVWVSEEDYEEALRYRWTLDRNGYPWGYVDRKRIYLHRWVANRMGLALDQVIDHIDRNPWNIRRENLRYICQQLNCFNQSRKKNNTSGYKGVYWDNRDQAWVANVMLDGKNYHSGYFDDPISAAVAYDKKAIELFGEEFAATNLKLGCLTEEDYSKAKPRRLICQTRKVGKSKFKGVTPSGKRFLAQIVVKRQNIYLGHYKTAEEGALAYDKYVLENKLNRVTNASLGLL